MKKIWSFILVLSFIFICEQTANAVLTNQAPAKFQNVTKKTNNTTSNTITSTPYSQVDVSPRLNELARRIKINWDPPRGSEGKEVVVLLKISRDGRLLSNNITKSSGVAMVDDAALNAIKYTAPFRPLPSDYQGQYLVVQVVFNNNVFVNQVVETTSSSDNTYTNSTQTPRDAVWMFINTDEGTNPNYGINKKRFSQYPMTKETIEEIYEYVKYRVNNYETRAKIIHTDVDANLKAGKIFYNFYIKETSSGEVIKLPVWTIIVQPRFDL